MADYIMGRNVLIKIGTTTVAACKQCEISISKDLKEVSSPLTGTDKKYIAQRTSWTASMSGLVADDQSMSELATYTKNGTSLTITFTSGQTTYTGSAFIKSWKQTANVGSIVTYSASLQGTGALTIS